MSQSPKMPEGQRRNSDGSSSQFVVAVNNLCLACKEPVSGWAYVLGHPYHGMVHWKTCRAWLPNDSQWPHEHAALDYVAAEEILSEQQQQQELP